MQTQTMTLNIQLPVANIYCYQDVVEAISHLFSEIETIHSMHFIY